MGKLPEELPVEWQGMTPDEWIADLVQRQKAQWWKDASADHPLDTTDFVAFVQVFG